MNEMVTKSIWWWPWQTEKVEAVLEGMAAQGWHLKCASRACTRFAFERGAPLHVRYCVDYQEKEKPEYLAILADDGWTLAHRESGWYIWRKAYDGERPELFTDTDSLVRRNTMILGSLTAVFAAQIPLFVVNMDNLDVRSPVAVGFIVAWALIVAILAGVSIGMALGIARMKRRAAGKGR